MYKRMASDVIFWAFVFTRGKKFNWDYNKSKDFFVKNREDAKYNLIFRRYDAVNAFDFAYHERLKDFYIECIDELNICRISNKALEYVKDNEIEVPFSLEELSQIELLSKEFLDKFEV